MAYCFSFFFYSRMNDTATVTHTGTRTCSHNDFIDANPLTPLKTQYTPKPLADCAEQGTAFQASVPLLSLLYQVRHCLRFFAPSSFLPSSKNDANLSRHDSSLVLARLCS